MSMWPDGISVMPLTDFAGDRTRSPRSAPFKAEWSRTMDDLNRELRQIGATAVALQVDIPLSKFRIDGLPRSTAVADSDAIVLSIGASKVGPLMFPCDTFIGWRANLRAVALSMEALRMVDRYGVTKHAEQYQGWKQLGTGSGEPASHLTRFEAQRILLDACGGDSEHDSEAECYRAARLASHPDKHAGDRTVWDLVEQAGRVLGLAS